jgi:peroxiredoxin
MRRRAAGAAVRLRRCAAYVGAWRPEDARAQMPRMRTCSFFLAAAAAATLTLACDSSSADAPKEAPKAAAGAGTTAVIGKPAPDFKLKDLNGKDVSLASFKGKTVVLEWFNPGCPFVKKSHSVGSLVDLAKRHTKAGVVWLAINSGAPGKQGNELAMNTDAAKTWSLEHPILRDEAGTVGKAYGATNTPHMFVIDKRGVLVYAGAIDNSPDAEGKSPEGGKLINYVDAALEDVAAGKPVRTPTSKAYGCSVKYASS